MHIKNISLHFYGALAERANLNPNSKSFHQTTTKTSKASWLLEVTWHQCAAQRCIVLTPRAHARLSLKGEELISLFLPNCSSGTLQHLCEILQMQPIKIHSQVGRVVMQDANESLDKFLCCVWESR